MNQHQSEGYFGIQRIQTSPSCSSKEKQIDQRQFNNKRPQSAIKRNSKVQTINSNNISFQRPGSANKSTNNNTFIQNNLNNTTNITFSRPSSGKPKIVGGNKINFQKNKYQQQEENQFKGNEQFQNNAQIDQFEKQQQSPKTILKKSQQKKYMMGNIDSMGTIATSFSNQGLGYKLDLDNQNVNRDNFYRYKWVQPSQSNRANKFRNENLEKNNRSFGFEKDKEYQMQEKKISQKLCKYNIAGRVGVCGYKVDPKQMEILYFSTNYNNNIDQQHNKENKRQFQESNNWKQQDSIKKIKVKRLGAANSSSPIKNSFTSQADIQTQQNQDLDQSASQMNSQSNYNRSPQEKLVNNYFQADKCYAEREQCEQYQIPALKDQSFIFDENYLKRYSQLKEFNPPLRLLNNQPQRIQLGVRDFIFANLELKQNIFPMKIIVTILKGSAELFVSKRRYPCWSNFDFYYNFFEFPHEINYPAKDNIKMLYFTVFAKTDVSLIELKVNFQHEMFWNFSEPTIQLNNKNEQQQQGVKLKLSDILKFKKNQQNKQNVESIKIEYNNNLRVREYDELKEEIQKEKQERKIFFSKYKQSLQKYYPDSFKNYRKQVVHNKHIKQQKAKVQHQIVYHQKQQQKIIENHKRQEKAIEFNNAPRINQESNSLKYMLIIKWKKLLCSVLFLKSLHTMIKETRYLLEREKYLMGIMNRHMYKWFQMLKHKGYTQSQRILNDSRTCILSAINACKKTFKKKSGLKIKYLLQKNQEIILLKEQGVAFYKAVRAFQKCYRRYKRLRNDTMEKLRDCWKLTLNTLCQEDEFFFSSRWIQKRLFSLHKKGIDSTSEKILNRFWREEMRKFINDHKKYMTHYKELHKPKRIAQEFASIMINIFTQSKRNKAILSSYQPKIYGKIYHIERIAILKEYNIYKLNKNPEDDKEYIQYLKTKGNDLQINQQTDETNQKADIKGKKGKKKKKFNKDEYLNDFGSSQGQYIIGDYMIGEEQIFDDFIVRPFLNVIPTQDEMKTVIIVNSLKYFQQK